MTGYGRGEASSGPFRAIVEIRSVNGRHADFKIRLPGDLASMEADLSDRLKEVTRRGRVEVSVQVHREGGAGPAVEIDRALVASYVKAAGALQREFGLTGDLSLQGVLGLPEVLRPRAADGAPPVAEQGTVRAAFDAAIEAHDAMRRQEGEILVRDIVRRVRAIETLQKRISKQAPRVLPQYARRLKARVKDLMAAAGATDVRALDAARLAQEVATLAERADITEELVRLSGYVEQLSSLLRKANEPIGKKLDFIMQEMNREANTINSKAVDLAICRDALEIKSEVEKIREQVQNLE